MKRSIKMQTRFLGTQVLFLLPKEKCLILFWYRSCNSILEIPIISCCIHNVFFLFLRGVKTEIYSCFAFPSLNFATFKVQSESESAVLETIYTNCFIFIYFFREV